MVRSCVFLSGVDEVCRTNLPPHIYVFFFAIKSVARKRMETLEECLHHDLASDSLFSACSAIQYLNMASFCVLRGVPG